MDRHERRSHVEYRSCAKGCRETYGALSDAGIGYGVHYAEPVHRMDAYRRDGVSLPETERACREVLSLPLYPGLPPEAVDRVIATIHAAA